MSFLSIFLALLLEQVKPLPQLNPLHAMIRNWVRWVIRSLDTGAASHARWVWLVAVGTPALLAFAIHWFLLWQFSWAAAAVWNVMVLYATLGFRQFSHHFTEIRDALVSGDEGAAKTALARWMRRDASELPRNEIVRHAIMHSVLSAHRNVFGVFAWYLVSVSFGLGPLGAVMYRVSEYFSVIAKRLARPELAPISDSVRFTASGAWKAVDWLPVRVTALSFAFVGSFEDAIESWRRYAAAAHPSVDNDGVLLAATAGAVNVELEGSLDHTQSKPELAHLHAIVGLVWRTVVMWMVFLALFSVARWAG